jgi:two-component system response regulator PhoP
MNQQHDSHGPLRVFLVDDDDDLREEMVLLLERAGFDVRGLADAAAFYRAHAILRCEVAVLDIGLRGEDGLSIAAALRSSGPVGIVMASARGAVEDRISALQRGADVYMVKPIHIEELVATIHTLGRRVRAVMPPAPQPGRAPVQEAANTWRLTQSGWVLCDPQGKTLKLTTTERAFMACFIEAGDAVVSREQLIQRIALDADDFDPRRLDVITSRLRRKAELAGMPLPLYAVRGKGFQLVRSTPSSTASHAG